jgi:hypothetical protein
MSVSSPHIEIAGEVGNLLAAWLRRTYPDARAKRLANDFNVAEVTAKRWLSGHLPDTSILLRMLARWGAPFAADVLAPTGPWSRIAALERDLDLLGRNLDAARAMLRAVQHEARPGSPPHVVGPVPRGRPPVAGEVAP